jgi:hypothetical protein
LHPIIQKTFGGLTKQYYFRQLFFGAIFSAIIIFMTSRGNLPPMYGVWAFAIVCTLLYPYSRYVYESVVGFIMGENVFFTSAIFMMLIKYLTMSLCWVFAIFIAPIGLAYLYFHHTKQEKLNN